MKRQILVAGSFDIIHKGHLALLEKAFSIGGNVRLGLASDEFIENIKGVSNHNNYANRKNEIEKIANSYNISYKIFKFDDIYGDAVINSSYTDIVVTPETLENAKKINSKRETKLDIHIVDMVMDEFKESIISSGKIRAGIMDKDGAVFYSDNHVEDIILTTKQRFELQNQKWGEIISDVEHTSGEIIAVGDATSKKLRDFSPFAFVYDDKIQRAKLSNTDKFNPPSEYKQYSVFNKPSTVTKELQKLIFHNKSSKFALHVNGEEDLSALAFLLEYPLNTIIYYGQPNQGLVKLPCTLGWKRKAYKLIYGEKRN